MEGGDWMRKQRDDGYMVIETKTTEGTKSDLGWGWEDNERMEHGQCEVRVRTKREKTKW